MLLFNLVRSSQTCSVGDSGSACCACRMLALAHCAGSWGSIDGVHDFHAAVSVSQIGCKFLAHILPKQILFRPTSQAYLDAVAAGVIQPVHVVAPCRQWQHCGSTLRVPPVEAPAGSTCPPTAAASSCIYP
jgi:hypothetical protein